MEEEIITSTSLSHPKNAQRDFHFKQLVEQQCGHQKVCDNDPPTPALFFFKITKKKKKKFRSRKLVMWKGKSPIQKINAD